MHGYLHGMYRMHDLICMTDFGLLTLPVRPPSFSPSPLTISYHSFTHQTSPKTLLFIQFDLECLFSNPTEKAAAAPAIHNFKRP